MEQAGGHELEPRLTFPGPPSSVGDVDTLPPPLHHFQDHLGWVLKVGVGDHDGIAPGGGQAGRHGRLLAEVAGEFDHLHPRITGRNRLEPLERGIATAVVDVDDLDVHPRSRQHLGEPRVRGVDDLLLVVAGDDDGQQPAGGSAGRS